MNELKIVNDKMTTIAFAELTGTTHKNVMAKARKLLKDLGILAAEFSATRLDSRGKEQTLLELDRDLSLTLAGQYEPKIAYSVAKAFNSNNQSAQPNLSPTEIAIIQLQAVQKVEQEVAAVQAQVDLQAVTVDSIAHIQQANANAVTRPPQGYESMASLVRTFAGVVPDVHIKGMILHEVNKRIARKPCSLVQEDTGVLIEYYSYNTQDCRYVINRNIQAGVKQFGTEGQVLQKVRSPYYPKAFKVL